VSNPTALLRLPLPRFFCHPRCLHFAWERKWSTLPLSSFVRAFVIFPAFPMVNIRVSTHRMCFLSQHLRLAECSAGWPRSTKERCLCARAPAFNHSFDPELGLPLSPALRSFCGDLVPRPLHERTPLLLQNPLRFLELSFAVRPRPCWIAFWLPFVSCLRGYTNCPLCRSSRMTTLY